LVADAARSPGQKEEEVRLRMIALMVALFGLVWTVIVFGLPLLLGLLPKIR